MIRSASGLRAKLEGVARDAGVDLFGVADITRLHQYLCPNGGEFLGGFHRAISIGVRPPDAAFVSPEQHDTLSCLLTYRHCLHDLVNPTLTRATLALAKELEEAAWRGYPINPYTIDGKGSRWAYPLKLTGYLAGLGWIGKSSLLINREFGPRFRLSVVLTDAPLAADAPASVACGTCHDCIDICPSKALSVGPCFDPVDPREDWSHGKICKDYKRQRAGALSPGDDTGLCDLCLYVCPFGKKKGKGLTSRTTA